MVCAMINDEEKQKTKFDRIVKRLRESLDKAKEYEIIEGDVKACGEFITSIPRDFDYQENQETERLKQRLLKKYKGKKLEDIIEGKEFKTEKGICYHIENQEKISLNTINPDSARKKILSNLKLIYGIGDVTERNLKKEGYITIEDLTKHPRFGSNAKAFMEIIDGGDTSQIVDWIGRWFKKSHPIAFYPSGLHNKEDFIFLDIETMGLFTRLIILFGVARIFGDHMSINQYLLRDVKEEPAALMGFLSHINKNSVLITFNGQTFDVPYIKERLAYYGMKADLEKPHFDIYYFSKRKWKEEVPNCKLTTLEKYLFGIERKDDIPGDLVPEFYDTYMKTQNIGPLIPIIEHNKQDLITLANIFSKLHKEWE
ncbi:MAG TPA: ribonuclease H-like domain-containing protein [Defluviitoga sp.]|nr:ribonuclease H-like domain-containing protein [Defluviitoga sp.]HQD43924.1 ribonuclease H-like domain-containing protein [Defluviitoga tunisiensis]